MNVDEHYQAQLKKMEDAFNQASERKDWDAMEAVIDEFGRLTDAMIRDQVSKETAQLALDILTRMPV